MELALIGKQVNQTQKNNAELGIKAISLVGGDFQEHERAHTQTEHAIEKHLHLSVSSWYSFSFSFLFLGVNIVYHVQLNKTKPNTKFPFKCLRFSSNKYKPEVSSFEPSWPFS